MKKCLANYYNASMQVWQVCDHMFYGASFVSPGYSALIGTKFQLPKIHYSCNIAPWVPESQVPRSRKCLMGRSLSLHNSKFGAQPMDFVPIASKFPIARAQGLNIIPIRQENVTLCQIRHSSLILQEAITYFVELEIGFLVSRSPLSYARFLAIDNANTPKSWVAHK